MTSQSPLAIEATGLVKSFGDTRAVDGVDLAVRTRLGLRRARPQRRRQDDDDPHARDAARARTPGSARVLGHDIVEEADAVRGAVSLTGQLASVDEDLTGRENLILLGRLLGPRSAPPRRSAPTELLEAFGLAEAAGKLVKNYSGGMRRRLDIAASIVVTPELMFLDEPTTGLDPRSRNQVWDIIRALVAEGTTILLCTQYLEEADQLADGIAVIDHGKVIAEGTPGQLKASVGSGALHVRLLDPEQRPEAEQRARPRARRRAPRARPGRAVGARAPTPTARAEAVAELAAPGVGIADFSLGQPSLDEVFLALTGHPAEETDRRAPTPSRRSSAHEHRPDAPTPTRRRPPTRPPSARRSPRPRARRAPSALSAALTFGWRGMLKVKHVPEQLLDVTITPVMFVLMFTYLFGGAIAGLDRRVPRLHPARASS